MSIDAQIDRLIDRLDASEVPFWAIGAAPWIEEIEGRLRFKLPAEYRSLVTRYSFPVITFDSVELFANRGDGAEDDISLAPFRDAHMSQWLTAEKLFQIGRPATGSYDPVCVDASSNDPHIVVLDHEDILQSRKKVHRRDIATSIGVILGERIDA